MERINHLPDSVLEATAKAIGKNAYYCLRVWSDIADDGDRVAEIARAAIKAYLADIRPQPAPAVLEGWRDVLFGNFAALDAAADSIDARGMNCHAEGVRAVAHALKQLAAAQRPVQTAPAVLDGWQSGVEACAKMLEKKAEDYAIEFGYSDMGALSFGSGFPADVKRDHHSTLLELAEELRTLLAAPRLEEQP